MYIITNLAFLLLFQCSFALNNAAELPKSSPIQDSQRTKKTDNSTVANILFKSTDGGKTWQNISNGLPKNQEGEIMLVDPGLHRVVDFTNKSNVYFYGGNGLYHIDPNSKTTLWKKETFPDKMSSFAPGKTGIYAYNYNGQILQKINGTSLWSPIYTNFHGKVRTVFETSGGTVFIGSDNGLFKSTNNGKTWKHVHSGGWVIKLIESNGVLVATSMGGIIRSTDNGENWTLVISEGGVGIDVALIQSGFAAITYNTVSKTRRVRTSYNGGKTWQAIDAELPASLSISTIVQVGENFFCGHPDGIYKSSDKGKTWKRILCPLDRKVYKLSVSGTTMYAILKNEGC